LWSATTEINYLVRFYLFLHCYKTISSLQSTGRSHHILYFYENFLQEDELATVTKLAREQREKITLAEEQSGIITEPVFYSVRPHPPKNIPSLKGQTLNLDDVVEDFGSNGSEDNTSAQLTAVIAEIDLIEAGTVTGWACSRSSDVPGPIKVVIYINRVQVAVVTAVQDVELPAAARIICESEGETTPGIAPKGFVATFPPLPQGAHTVRRFFFSFNFITHVDCCWNFFIS